MRYIFLLISVFCLNPVSQAQDAREQVVAVIKQMFNGMRAADSNAVKAVFHPEAQLQTSTFDREGKPRLATTPIPMFASRVGSAKPQSLDERIWSYDVRIDQGLATVWTEYTFFANGQFSHCGVNAFQLIKMSDGWKIHQITDTRRKENCIMEAPLTEKEVGAFIDKWHQAAATADEAQYFGAMSADGVFLGTDATERWVRDDMAKAMEKAFAGKSAWDFKSRNRQIMLSADGRYAWWDELLDTWMGVCRGSGVLERDGQSWKIKHYDLAVTVPNDKMKPFMKLTKKK